MHDAFFSCIMLSWEGFLGILFFIRELLFAGKVVVDRCQTVVYEILVCRNIFDFPVDKNRLIWADFATFHFG